MDAIIRNVADIGADDRRSLEHVVGQHLADNQQVIIRVMTVQPGAPTEHPAPQPGGGLPDWCNVYDGLTDEEIAQVEASALDRSHWARPSA